MTDEDRSYLPYYYGLNYEAPPDAGPGAFPSAGLGLLAGRAMRQSVVGGSDAGLWYERLVGVPLEPQRMGLNFGNETGGQELWGESPKSDWTSYRTFPEAVGELAGEQFSRVAGPVVRTGDVLRGKNPYGMVDEINDIRTVARAMGLDVMGAVGAAATPGMFGSRVRPSTVSGLGYKDQLLAERQGLINKVKGIQGDYDQMIAESAKITGLLPKNTVEPGGAQVSAFENIKIFPAFKFPDGKILQDVTHGEIALKNPEVYSPGVQEGFKVGNLFLSLKEIKSAGGFEQAFFAKNTSLKSGMLERVQNRFQTAYDAAREKSGASFVDIAVLRDNLGLSQEKMAGMLRKASREGHAVLELGERSVVDDYLKGGAVDGKLLVRLDPEFFENIGTYIKPEIRQSLQQMEVEEIEKALLEKSVPAIREKSTLILSEPLNPMQLEGLNRVSGEILKRSGVDISDIRKARPKDWRSEQLLDFYIQTSKDFGSEMTGEEFFRKAVDIFGNEKEALQLLDAAGFTEIKALRSKR